MGVYTQENSCSKWKCAKQSKSGRLLQGITSFKIIENKFFKKENLRLKVTFEVVLSSGLYTQAKSPGEWKYATQSESSLKQSKTGPLLQGITSFKIIENQFFKKGNQHLNVIFHGVSSMGLHTQVKSRSK
jgi:hypothetical protein